MLGCLCFAEHIGLFSLELWNVFIICFRNVSSLAPRGNLEVLLFYSTFLMIYFPSRDSEVRSLDIFDEKAHPLTVSLKDMTIMLQ